jgi:hypothetical protein
LAQEKSALGRFFCEWLSEGLCLSASRNARGLDVAQLPSYQDANKEDNRQAHAKSQGLDHIAFGGWRNSFTLRSI